MPDDTYEFVCEQPGCDHSVVVLGSDLVGACAVTDLWELGPGHAWCPAHRSDRTAARAAA